MTDMLEFLQNEKKEATSGGGFHVVGLMTFTPGIKVYIAGLGNEQTFFPYTNAAEKGGAVAKAKKFAADNGGDVARANNPCYAFIVPKDTCLAGGQNWNTDQYYIRPMWNEKVIKDGGVEYDDAVVFNSVKPHVASGAVTPGKPFYGALRMVASPYHARRGEAGKTKTRVRDGEETKEFPVVFVLDQVFSGRDKAEEYAKVLGSSAPTVSDPSYPDTAHGWTDIGAWVKTKPQIQADFERLKQEGSKPLPLLLKYLAGEYSCAVEHIKMVIGIE